MASLPYPRCPPNSFHRTHSKFVCASPPTEFTEIYGGGYSPTEFTEYTEAFGVEEPPTDFTEYTEASGVEEPPTDAHRCAQMVRLRRVLWEDSFVAAWVWQGCHTLLKFALLALLVQRRQLYPLERDSSKKVCVTITFLLLLHQTIRHDTLVYDRLNSIIVNK